MVKPLPAKGIRRRVRGRGPGLGTFDRSFCPAMEESRGPPTGFGVCLEPGNREPHSLGPEDVFYSEGVTYRKRA